MRNAVYAAISLVVAIVAVVLAVRPEAQPPETPPVSPTRAPDPAFAVTPTPPPPVTPTPPPAVSPTPTSTPTPTPTPGTPTSTATPLPGTPTPTPGAAPVTPTPTRTPVPTPTPATAAPTPTPQTTFTYRHFDSNAAVASPGQYAFLVSAGRSTRVATTYEQLRTSTTSTRFNVRDSREVSRAARYDAVAVGDLFEWSQAEDCWIRFQVTATPDRPARGITREFGVRVMTYAFTGCSGAVAANAPATVDLGPLPDLGNPQLAYPIRHGPWQFVPEDWDGPLEDLDPRESFEPELSSTSSLAVARQLPYWRDPALPLPWDFDRVHRVGPRPHDGYRATYVTDRGRDIVSVGVYRSSEWGRQIEAFCGWVCDETRVIGGRPARVWYGPLLSNTGIRATVWVYDPETAVEYVVWEENRLLGGDIDRVVAIARSLFETAASPPNSVRYGRFDTGGAAETPGSHAFLSGIDDGATAVTTYEDLRGGVATALLIHTSDIDGTSRARLFSALEVGDDFEWWRADNCWIRFRVSEVMPDPPGAPGRRLFAVERGAFAFTGCGGVIPVNAYSYLHAGPLPALGGTSLAVPVAQGPWQLVPEGWRGAADATAAVQPRRPGQFQARDSFGSAELDEARQIEGWREPVLPAGWTFTAAVGGVLTSTIRGYCATFSDASGQPAFEVCGTQGVPSSSVLEASWDGGAGVREFHSVGDRPALVAYSPQGPNHWADFRVEASVYDSTAGIVYTVFGYHPSLQGSNVDAVVAIARSLFEPPNPP